MWQPLESLRNTVAFGDGLIRLWAEPNYMQYQKWTTKEDFGNKIYYYFFVPAGFYKIKEDTFAYNFPFKYTQEQVEVNGFVNHDGPRKLQEGLTEPFWHLEESERVECELMTGDYTKLPYLIIPNLGEPNYYPEKRYFIPVGENY